MRVNSKSENKQQATKPVIHNVFILDSSGSMYGSKYESAVKGINAEIKALQAQNEVNYIQSFVEFSNSLQIYKRVWLKDIKELTTFNGSCIGNNTALYDAIGITITDLLKDLNPEDKVLLKIFTDGEENCSIKYNAPKIKELITTVEENHGFTVTFEGTKMDTDFVIRNLNIKATNTLVHNNTGEGVAANAVLRAQATMLYAKAVMDGEDVKENFYSKSIK